MRETTAPHPLTQTNRPRGTNDRTRQVSPTSSQEEPSNGEIARRLETFAASIRDDLTEIRQQLHVIACWRMKLQIKG